MSITRENVIILALLITFTFGIYGIIWFARTAKTFGDDSTTCVILLCIPGLNFFFYPYFNLRYMQISHKLNGREMAWYEAFFFLIGPMITQLNINEYIIKRLRQQERERAGV